MGDIQFISTSIVQAANQRKKLKELNYFFPLVGRLAIIEVDDETSSFFVDCSNAGVLFVHAAANEISISDIIGPKVVPSFVHSFFQLNEVKNYGGYTYNHVVVDGISFVLFFNSWAKVSQGSIELFKPPALRRWFPNGVEASVSIPNSCLTQIHEFIPPPLQHDGKITVYGGAEEGSMDIEACFLPETLQALVNDEEFMDSITIYVTI
ncbi:uncharacterized acetyltransferase At3g50280-like [Durio zibethinus]|uniref:Uncharacterized acetyltransferase At3g50280-like n=1 Tax=Durio zibethinus TaxID=66656 RepID=A0A6P5Y550_DURZI|nr:uncharacterized acetyltransferase At3g50280-like [Durio zibethinus]